MNWISLILQLLALRRGMHESASMAETAKLYAERGKRAVAAALVGAVAALFFFSGILVAVLEAGLQIDRGGGLAYSGLMVSATILAGLGLLLVGAAWLIGHREPAPPPPPPPSPRGERIKDLLEDFLAGFLQNLAQQRTKAKEEGPGGR